MRLMILPLLILPTLAQTAPAPAERGAQLLTPFKMELKQTLMKGLEEGPESAVTLCQQEAPAIARRHSNNGIQMGRSSDKLRSPENRPPAWVEPILSQFQRGELTPVTVEITKETTGYAEPITIAPPCLACHGQQIANETRALLSHYYPEDEATGYQLGQWRGLFWVEFPTESAQKGG
ncbi:c-type heme family protein [Ferrimonas gelatinilytica]|uniref:DUF3365 domain-containing protein n=1 Tax=Ferrimonas gelatinilytica TaxID=1255257 RepID=A0ABP9RTP1_9GAMM